MSRSKVQLRKLPYIETDVPADRSKNDITNLLRLAGADGVQWSEVYRPKKQTEVKFVKDQRLYQLAIPIFTDDIERAKDQLAPYRYRDLLAKRERAMYRAMFNYIQGLFKAQQWGLMSFEEAFIGHATVSLPTGERISVKEAVLNRRTDLQLPSAEEVT